MHFVDDSGGINNTLQLPQNSSWRGETVIRGIGTYSTDYGGRATQSDIQYSQLVGNMSDQFTITVPTNTSFVTLNATMGPNNGWLDVGYSPPPPTGVQQTSSSDCYNPYIVPNVISHYRVLDPTIQYKMTIFSYYDADNKYAAHGVGVSSVTFYSAEQPKPKKSNVGGIAGGVVSDLSSTRLRYTEDTDIDGYQVGGVLGALLVVGLGLFFWRRRRVGPRPLEPLEGEIEEAVVTPYSQRSELAEQHKSRAMLTPLPTDSHMISTFSTNDVSQAPQGRDLDMLFPAGRGRRPVDPQMSSTVSSPSEFDSTGRSLSYTESTAPKGMRRMTDSSMPTRIRTRTYTQHADAGGLLPVEVENENVDVPPVYNPQWGSATDVGASTVVSYSSGAEPVVASTEPIVPAPVEGETLDFTRDRKRG